MAITLQMIRELMLLSIEQKRKAVKEQYGPDFDITLEDARFGEKLRETICVRNGLIEQYYNDHDDLFGVGGYSCELRNRSARLRNDWDYMFFYNIVKSESGVSYNIGQQLMELGPEFA